MMLGGLGESVRARVTTKWRYGRRCFYKTINLSELVTPIHGVRSPDESQTHLLPSILSIITLTTLPTPPPRIMSVLST